MTFLPHGPFILAVESEVPWWWVAIIFIAFIQWLVGKIRGTDQTQSPEDEVEANREAQSPAPRPAHTPSGPPPVPSDPAAELRRFLEQLSGAPATPPPPPPPPPVPRQAAPAKPATPKRPDLTPQEKEALHRLEERRRKIKVEAANRELTKVKRVVMGTAATNLRDMLRQHGSVRNAVILKEVLDKPRGLRNDWSIHTDQDRL